jgi:hypothetical protein
MFGSKSQIFGPENKAPASGSDILKPMRHTCNTMVVLAAIVASPSSPAAEIVKGSLVKLKQGGQIAHVGLPARVSAITEFNALFFSDGNMSIVPLAWLEVVV